MDFFLLLQAELTSLVIAPRLFGSLLSNVFFLNPLWLKSFPLCFRATPTSACFMQVEGSSLLQRTCLLAPHNCCRKKKKKALIVGLGSSDQKARPSQKASPRFTRKRVRSPSLWQKCRTRAGSAQHKCEARLQRKPNSSRCSSIAILSTSGFSRLHCVCCEDDPQHIDKNPKDVNKCSLQWFFLHGLLCPF